MKVRVAALVLALLSCHHEAAQAPAPKPPGRFGTAAITGRVTFQGTPPAPPHAAKLGFPDCARFAALGPADPGLVVDPQGGVRDAFLWIRDLEGDYPVPAEPVTLDQKQCEFTPRVFGVRAGQPVVLVNSDPFLHNVHGATAFNVPLPTEGARLTRTFPKPGVMTPVLCDVHNWMRAFAGVVPHPFWAVSAADGSYAIERLPAGTYTLELWQERTGWQRKTVTVADGERKRVDFSLSGR